MIEISFFITLLIAAGHFGWAIVCGVKDKRLHNRYGPNLEVDFREEPIGFICITAVYIAMWCWLVYLTANSAIKVYSLVFD